MTMVGEFLKCLECLECLDFCDCLGSGKEKKRKKRIWHHQYHHSSLIRNLYTLGSITPLCQPIPLKLHPHIVFISYKVYWRLMKIDAIPNNLTHPFTSRINAKYTMMSSRIRHSFRQDRQEFCFWFVWKCPWVNAFTFLQFAFGNPKFTFL